MALLPGVHGAVAGGAITDGDAALVQTTASWGAWVEGVRRFGVATYLLSIALGLYTIVTVIRLQSRRIRELADEPAHS